MHFDLKDGRLVGTDGTVLGRLVELTLDIDERTDGGLQGDGLCPSLREDETPERHEERKQTKEFAPVSPEVTEVWELYSQLIGKGRRKLNPARRRDIERALAVCELPTVKRAVIGLSRSPYHNGQNDTGTKYLDIRYALRGNGARGESIDERVERMAHLAAPGALTAAPATRDRGVLQGAIDDDMRAVQRAWRRDGTALDEGQRRQRDEAIARLVKVGIITSYRDSDGWPIFKDADA